MFFFATNLKSDFDHEVLFGGYGSNGELTVEQLRNLNAKKEEYLREDRKVIKKKILAEVNKFSRNHDLPSLTVCYGYPQGGIFTEYELSIDRGKRTIKINSVLSKSSRIGNEDGNVVRFKNVMEYEI